MSAARTSRLSLDSLVVARSAALGASPPLAALAALAAFGELLLGRVLARAFVESLSRSQRLALDHVADLLRNLGAVASLVALGLSVQGLLGLPALSARRRFLLAGFAGVLVGSGGLALLTPRAAVGTGVVALAAASGHVVAILAAVSAAAWTAPRPARAALGTWATGLLFSLGNLVLLLLAPKLPWAELWKPVREASHAIAFAARHTGEVAFLLAPLLLGAALLRPAASRARALGAAVAAALLGGTLAWAAQRLPEDFAVLLYGASRLSLLAEVAPVAYGPLLGAALAVALRALLGPQPFLRQAGLGMLLLFAAGYAPRSASGGLWLGLGMLLLGRAAMAWAAEEAQRSVASAEPSRASPSSSASSDAA